MGKANCGASALHSDPNAGLHADIAVARADGRTAAKLDVEVLVAQCRAQVDLSTVLHRRRTEGLEPFEGRIGTRCSNRSGGIEVLHPGAAPGGDPICGFRKRAPACPSS